ncbi:hypothetical protein PSH25_003632, partial [Micromonospora sp. PSH25]|nr:hypothetical protein [Micromonospora foliorum]
MAKKMLGKVVAGAALGGASLLVFAPGIAFANGHEDGKVYAKPHVVKAGDEVKLLEICPDRQEHAYVWSKVTGKVKLKPAHEDRGEDREWREEENSSDHDNGKDENGKDDNGKGGQGGGAAAKAYGDEDRKKWKGEERGQDAEEERDNNNDDYKDEHSSENGRDKGCASKDGHGSDHGEETKCETK